MEILYSSAIFALLKRAQKLSRKILAEEVSLPLGRSRFFVKNTGYPLHFIAFEHPSRLGYFQADLYEIGINKVYLFESDENLLNLLRHELAHYLTYIYYGPHVSHHGKEFHEICQRYGWNTEVSRAAIKTEKIAHQEKVLAKVHKLLSLANSSHQGEAEAATLKAQELLLKYNLNLKETRDEMRLLRLFPQKRSSAKLSAISSILRTFLVYPVFNHGKGCVYLELVGEKVNVEVAEYVANFLDQKFEKLWQEAKKETPDLKGIASKNSFFRGLAKGYLDKAKVYSHALIKLENQLVEKAHQIYPHLNSAKSFFKHHDKAAQIGQKKGENLNIQQGIKSKSNVKFLQNGVV